METTIESLGFRDEGLGMRVQGVQAMSRLGTKSSPACACIACKPTLPSTLQSIRSPFPACMRDA